VAEFSGDRLSTEGGALLLREADRKIDLLRRVADCFTDTRQPERVEHRLPEMLAQRIYGLALGYEDLNDHEQLRSDPLLAVLAGKQEIEKSLAGKSTLNRLELTPSGSPLAERYHKIGYFARSDRRTACEDFPGSTHTYAETDRAGPRCNRYPAAWEAGRPLLPRILRALLLPSVVHLLRGSSVVLAAATVEPGCVGGEYHGTGTDRSADRAQWPKVRILLRADSGFCREELMAWCESHRVDYVFGFARNQRLRRKIAPAMRQARQEHARTAKPARVFTEFFYRTRKSWSRSRRVVAKAEQIEGKENPRYVVTSLANRSGWRKPSTNSSTARGARWRIASRNS